MCRASVFVAAVAKISTFYPPHLRNTPPSISFAKMLPRRSQNGPKLISANSFSYKDSPKPLSKRSEVNFSQLFKGACSYGGQNFCPPQLRNTSPSISLPTKMPPRRSQNGPKLTSAKSFGYKDGPKTLSKRSEVNFSQLFEGDSST